jgi:hypothetical protein
MLTKSPFAAAPACLAAWMLAASAMAMPAGGKVELCTGNGVRQVAEPGAPKSPAPPECAKACHFGGTRRLRIEQRDVS